MRNGQEELQDERCFPAGDVWETTAVPSPDMDHGEKTPEKLALGFKKNCISYGQLCEKMKKAAGYMKAIYHVEEGDMVLLTALSKPEYVIAYLAIQYIGAVSVPADKAAKAESMEFLCDYVKPKLVLADGAFDKTKIQCVSYKEFFEKCYEEENPALEDYQEPSEVALAEMLFTTGTTGRPKGAMLSIENIYASIHNTWHGVGMLKEDVVLIPLPLNHSVGMRVLRTALYLGATVILQNGFTFARELENNISNFQCTGVVSVPASLEVVYRQMQDKFPQIMGKLRYMEIGAGSLSYEMKRKLVQLLPDTQIINTWGSSETGGAIFLNVSKHPEKLTSLGKPIDGVELQVRDQDGNVIQARDINTAGRMVLRGKMQMQGYFQMPEETKKTLVDGWLYTNDMVYTDEDGYVYMLGRADDIINVGGEKVSPIEVENCVQEYEDIRECACIGVEDPDGILGQVPILYVVPESGHYKEEELIQFLSGRMEKYKLPKQYLVIDELPRNRMKKLDRKALRKMWSETGTEQLMNDTIQSIITRRSIRDFTEKRIPKAYLDMIVKCGIYAPNGHNLQTWRFTVIQDKQKIRDLKSLIGRIAKEKKVYFYGFQNPDTVILVSNDKRNENSIQDSACAAENIMLAAHSYGIGSTWINALRTLCDEPEIREMLSLYGIPNNHIVWSMIAMGYPAKEGKTLAKKMNVVNWIDESGDN